MDKLALIVAAIGDISAAIAPAELTKKPNVADVEAMAGFDITASERDEAWELFSSSASSGTEITNNYSSTIALFGVTIKAGETKSVPKFNKEHRVIKQWLDKKVITVK